MARLRFHPAARAELIEAIVHVEAHRPGHGEALGAEVEELIERMIELPESGAPLSGYPPERDVRAFRLRKFPYSLILVVVHGERMVYAVAHQRRRPGYWASRLV